MLISPIGTDPDRTNPQAVYFTSTMRPTAEGFKNLFGFKVLFLRLCRPCPIRYFLLVEHSNWGVPNPASRGTLGCIGILIVQRLNLLLDEDSMSKLSSCADDLLRSFSSPPKNLASARFSRGSLPTRKDKFYKQRRILTRS